MTGHRGALVERFWPKVDTASGPDACHPFTGKVHPTGYGQIENEPGLSPRTLWAHRVAWELTNGPIPVLPNGRPTPLDHTCHNEAAERGECAGGSTCSHRRCCNPRHLRPSTHAENGQASPLTNVRKTHCPAGHEYTPENTYDWRGWRICRACRRERSRLREDSRRASRVKAGKL